MCIPTYNRLATIRTTLASLYENLSDPACVEVVVCDNNSSDGTADWVEAQNFPNLRVMRGATTVSMYANHNLCTAASQSDWTMFLHSDDVVVADPLAVFNAHVPGPDLSVIMPKRPLHRTAPQIPFTMEGRAAVGDLLRWPTSIPSGAYFRTDALRETPFEENNISADLSFLFDQLARNRHILISDRLAVEVVIGEAQASAKIRRMGGYRPIIAEIVAREAGRFPDFGRDVLRGFGRMPLRDKHRVLDILRRARMWSLLARLAAKGLVSAPRALFSASRGT
ncbi:glycosyltransferase family 2 protein [Marinovum sp. B10]|uniref:glycosyltransferase family 2 protein n=1 Tax=Marinovum sp. B10 TaxID=3449224 RepID=UPI003EDC5F0D